MLLHDQHPGVKCQVGLLITTLTQQYRTLLQMIQMIKSHYQSINWFIINSSHQTLQHDIKSHYQSIGSSFFCCPSPSVAAVRGWETRAGWRSVERLYAELSNTATPSPPGAAVGGWGPALYTGLLSMGISSEGGASVKKISNCNHGLQN